MAIDEKTLAEWEADQGHGPFLKGRVKQLLREVRALTALLDATYLPLSIRELRRTQGTAAAAKQWEEQSQAFIAGLQKQRDDALAEVGRLRGALEDAEYQRDRAQANCEKATGQTEAALAEVRRLRAVALTFEDEADRLGGEVKRLREVEAAARRVFEGKAELPALWATLDPLPDVDE